MKDPVTVVGKLGLLGFVTVLAAGIFTYVTADNEPAVERLVVFAMVVLVAVLVGAVIAIEAHKKGRDHDQ